MKIKFVEIANFRKLKSCRVDFAEKETIFVGANNSGKTSAMDALILFLKRNKKFTTRDFTLSNWGGINKIAAQWTEKATVEPDDLSLDKWLPYLPFIDVWINVEDSEIHHVPHLIPTLDWNGGLLGIRLRLEPKNIEELYKEFSGTYQSSKKTTEAAKKGQGGASISLKLWPYSMWDFLERKLDSHFDIRSFILDPKKCKDTTDGCANPQILTDNIPLDKLPFEGLIKIDVIYAQRGFSDPNTEPANSNGGNLSAQLRDYYKKHLNPSEEPNVSDISALQSIESAKEIFDVKLMESFRPSLKELEELNYPGFGNPSINISSQVNVIDGLNHEAAVQFGVLKKEGAIIDAPLHLPEKYNGLGYQNLISMVFKLIRFRDEWMRVGKSKKPADDALGFEPLHIVLVEEPEAHLHAQIQQVFIRKAFSILRKHDLLQEKPQFSTQLVVSTHSSHIAHEIDFTSLRYFRRKPPESAKMVPTSIVVNLSTTFGKEDETTKFAIRYLKTTHCDLFFADATILIEGPAERMLIPHFIAHYYSDLTSCYISVLEIGGSHAHALKPLIEDLGIICLIITDIDSIDSERKSIQPEKSKEYETGNHTLKSWLPKIQNLDELLALKKGLKIAKNFPNRVAYQTPINIKTKNGGIEKTEEVLPYTFEDSLVFQNLELFKTLTGGGLIKKFKDASNKSEMQETAKDMYDILTNGSPKKAEFALELLFIEEPNKLQVPEYIAEGLQWLRDQLITKQDGLSLN